MTTAGYDGSIRIDTSIDSKSFNAGVSKIGAALKGIGKVLAIGLSAAATGVALIGVALIGLSFVAIRLGKEIWKVMEDVFTAGSAGGKQITQIKDAFEGLKSALAVAFLPLLTAAMPVIMTVVDWLTRMLNIVARIIGGLTGQAAVLQYVAGSAKSAASSTGSMAKNTDKANKAAKGALAAFDELNVLQRKNEEEDMAGVGGGAGNGMQTIEMPSIDVKAWWDQTWANIKQWFADAWEDIKQWFADAWEWIKTDGVEWATGIVNSIIEFFKNGWETNKQLAKDAWEKIKEVWGVVSAWFDENVIQPVLNFFKNGWETNKQIFNDAVAFLKDGWETNKQKFIDAWQAVIDFFKSGWEDNKQRAIDAWENIKTAWNNVSVWFKTNVLDPVGNFFKEGFEGNKQRAIDAWEGIKEIWKKAGEWFTTNVTDPIKEGFKTSLDWIKEKWETIFGGVKDFTKNIVNTIIDFINSMISAVASGINGIIGGLNSIKVTIPKWVPVFGGESWGMNIPTVTTPQIPRLATGAVIPPHAEFLAMLGDQRYGKNIEAPAALFQQMLDEAVARGGGSDEITIRFEGSLGELVRILKPVIKKENKRVGTSLIKGSEMA